MPRLKSLYDENPAGLLRTDQKSFDYTEHLPSEFVLQPAACMMSKAFVSDISKMTKKPVSITCFINFVLLVAAKL